MFQMGRKQHGKPSSQGTVVPALEPVLDPALERVEMSQMSGDGVGEESRKEYLINHLQARCSTVIYV